MTEVKIVLTSFISI